MENNEEKKEEKTFLEKLKDFFVGVWNVIKKLFIPIVALITLISVSKRKEAKKEIKEDKKEIKEEKKEIEKESKEVEKKEEELEKKEEELKEEIEKDKSSQEQKKEELADFLPGLKR